MSEPGRICRCLSATTDVRVYRGSIRNERRAVFVARLKCPLESARMIFSRVGSHHQNDVGVLDVLPVVGHRASTERGGQTGHRGAVSNSSLMIYIGEPHGAHRLRDEIRVPPLATVALPTQAMPLVRLTVRS